MRRPLVDRIPPDSPELARFDARVEGTGSGNVRTNYEKETTRAHRRCWRRYSEWCALKRRELVEALDTAEGGLAAPDRVHGGYQAEPGRLTTELVTEFTRYMCSVKRYAVPTCLQAIRALELYAARAGVRVSVAPAHEVVAEWRETVAKVEAAAEAELRASKRAERVPW